MAPRPRQPDRPAPPGQKSPSGEQDARARAGSGANLPAHALSRRPDAPRGAQENESRFAETPAPAGPDQALTSALVFGSSFFHLQLFLLELSGRTGSPPGRADRDARMPAVVELQQGKDDSIGRETDEDRQDCRPNKEGEETRPEGVVTEHLMQAVDRVEDPGDVRVQKHVPVQPRHSPPVVAEQGAAQPISEGKDRRPG